MVGMILSDAFSPMAGVGAAIGWGVKRGVYSNEAGQGTGPHAAAAQMMRRNWLRETDFISYSL